MGARDCTVNSTQPLFFHRRQLQCNYNFNFKYNFNPASDAKRSEHNNS
jgi:hypothetical protein